MTSLAVDVFLQSWFTWTHSYVTVAVKFAGPVVLIADCLIGEKAETKSF